MGKFIKYFDNASDFAEYYNFGEWPEGPNGEVTMVAYIGVSDKVYYNDAATEDEFGVSFSIENDTVDYSATTNTFSLKTGAFWFERIMDGMNNKTYQPGTDETGVTVSFDANDTPLTKTYTIIGKWYKDDNGQKGDYIEGADVYATFTQEADPEADPVKLTIIAGYTSDGQNPTRLGNGPLTGATRVYYEDNGTEVDILNNIYIQSKRAWYQFPAEGNYEVNFEFESENQTVGDYFIYSQATYLGIYTNYPQLAEQTNFRFNGPLMQSSIEELTLGEGMLSVNGFLMANSLNHISLEDQNKLPALNGNLMGVAAEGTVEAESRDVENFSMWENGIPSGWTILPASS